MPARRRAAPVGALAATEKPSQRQRSPSRETSRWPGLEQRQRRAASVALDHADLREPAREFRRRLNMIGERLDALRQRRIGGIDVGARPAHGRRRIDRSFEIVAERGAERGLVALLDGEIIDHGRPEILGVDMQEAWPSVLASVSRRCARRSASASGTRADIERLPGGGMRGFGTHGGRFGFDKRGLRASGSTRQSAARSGAAAPASSSSSLCDRRDLLRDPIKAATVLPQRLFECMASCGEVGKHRR